MNFNSIIGKKISSDRPTYEGKMYAELVVPGDPEPRVEVVGEIREMKVIYADPTPQPAGPGSWPPSPAPDPFGGFKAQLWGKSKAKLSKPDEEFIF